ncbi:hypothetical protein Btru_012800 [Bulinus truncatus]|nr:hypothetical protein Btru_012800 [Bulinus truncatus]
MGLKFLLVSSVVLTAMLMSTVRAVCPDGRCGSPDTYCPPDSTLYCSLCSDPRLCTFSEEKANINLLGPFLFSKFNYIMTKDPTKTVSVSVVAQTSIYGGKVYVSGLQADILVHCNSAASNVVFNLQTRVENDQAVFYLTDLLGQTQKYTYKTNDEYQQFQVKSVAKKCCTISVIITPERYFIISLDCFKISIGFRPFESGKTPCLYVEIDANYITQFEPQSPYPTQLCLADSFYIDDLKNLTGLSSNAVALNFQGFTSNLTNTKFPLLPSNIVEFNTLLRGCPKDRLPQVIALSALLKDAHLVECLTTATGFDGLIGSVITGVQIGCYGDLSKCDLFLDYLNVCTNAPSNQALLAFYSLYCLAP